MFGEIQASTLHAPLEGEFGTGMPRQLHGQSALTPTTKLVVSFKWYATPA